MKIEYSADVDALYVYLQEVEVARSEAPADGIVVDLDRNGAVVGIEILDASDRFDAVDATLMLADSGPNYTKSESDEIRSIPSAQVHIPLLVEDDVD